MMMFSGGGGGGCGVSGSDNSNNIYFTKLKYHKQTFKSYNNSLNIHF